MEGYVTELTNEIQEINDRINVLKVINLIFN